MESLKSYMVAVSRRGLMSRLLKRHETQLYLRIEQYTRYSSPSHRLRLGTAFLLTASRWRCQNSDRSQ